MTIEDEEPSEEEIVEMDLETRRLYIHKFYGHVSDEKVSFETWLVGFGLKID